MTVTKCTVCGVSNSEYCLFTFPSNEPYQTEWKKFANLTGVDKLTSYKLCVRHFSEDAIIPSSQPKDGKPKTKRRRLYKTAVPTLHKETNENRCYITKNRNTYVCLICNKRSGGTHFQFPKNLQIREEWLKLCGYGPDFCNGEKDWYLCSAHFPECDLLRKRSLSGRTCLRKGVKPTLLLPKPKSSGAAVPISGKTFIYETIPGYSFILPKTGSCIIINDGNESATPCNKSVAEHDTSSSAEELSRNYNNGSEAITLDIKPIILEAYLPSSPVKLLGSSTSESTQVGGNFLLQNISANDIVEAMKAHKDCPTCITFAEHLPTKRTNHLNKQRTQFRKHSAAKKRIRYSGDIKTSNLATLEDAQQSIVFLKNEIKRYRQKNDILNKRNRRLQIVAKTYKQAVDRMNSTGRSLEDVICF